jgi:transposase-like protein
MSHAHCPRCHAGRQQIKDGFTPAGSQRLRCKECGCRYTPSAKERGYDDEVRMQALRLHLEGLSLRAISRVLGVNHQTAANWINAYANQLPLAIPDSILELIEIDGLLS